MSLPEHVDPTRSSRVPFARRTSVRTRLLLLAAVGPIALIIVVGLGVRGFSQQEGASETVQRYLAASGQIADARFYTGDWNGWQTAYAFDAVRGVPDAAKDTGDSRASFLASAAHLQDVLDSLGDNATLSETARSHVAEAKQAFDDFMVTDRDVAAGYAAGTTAGREAANELVLGEEIKNFTRVAEAVAMADAEVQAKGAAAAEAARSDAASGRLTMILAGLAGGVLALLLAVAVSATIRRPLHALRLRMGALADDERADLTARLDAAGNDELASIATSFNAFVGRVQDAVQALASSAVTIASSTEALATSSVGISAAAVEASAQAGVVASAASQVSINVQTVAQGSEEMGIAIHEIARSAAEAAAVASSAVAAAEATNADIVKLGTSSREIGGVLQLITGIAEQTNLLALNATIEAARAGDAGKGFAVVAGEVKELAHETARATEDIGRRIAQIQEDTALAVRSIEGISGVIGRINEHQGTIAAAVEEQLATNGENTRNVGGAALGADQIAGNIGAVAEAAEATTQQITQSQLATDELVSLSRTLDVLVARFEY